ncbi:MAG: DUF3604 domain-containing protein [Myxococcota bacterium]|nr:DUF3604 domain-containing protein [Myxococcota bacterium]
MVFRRYAISFFLIYGCVFACKEDEQEGILPEKIGRCEHFDELRKPWFGDTHVHTSLSLDANLQATRLGPADAYAFARGEEIRIQPYDDNGVGLRSVKIQKPLDFVMLSDHAEFFGTISVCTDPGFGGYDSEDCRTFREDPQTSFVALNSKTAYDIGYPDLCLSSGFECENASNEVWKRIQREAETAYDRSSECSFTSFVGYEWTSNPRALNLHRNILFRNHQVPSRVSSVFEAPTVEDLWSQLKEECLDADTGCDVLTIPHNSNLSNGSMFLTEDSTGSAFSSDYAGTRASMEPLFEVFQHKGDSECSLATGASDEYCRFEKLPWNNLASANLGGASFTLFAPAQKNDFLRDALLEGLTFESDLGVNPFQYGMIASTDTHIAAPGAVSEKKFPGHGGAGQPNRIASSDEPTRPIDGLTDIAYFNPGGLAGVWAEENSREAIFQALRRKETFGTSGPRITVRFFGGWNLSQNLCRASDRIKQAYEKGVPMGGTLTPPSMSAKPSFFVIAQQDLGSAEFESTPLQSIQLIKGWIDTSTIPSLQTSVTTIAGSNTEVRELDLSNCGVNGENFGESELCVSFTDDSYSPEQRAFYYIRVLEQPTCRWSTRQCLEANYNCNEQSRKIDQQCCNPLLGLNRSVCESVDCSDDNLSQQERICCEPFVQPVINERAWTSPIWISPK